MARYSRSYSGLIERLAEVESLRRFAAREMAINQPLPVHISRANALCRASVVLLSSHVEGYVGDLADLAIERIYNRSLPKSKLGPSFRYHLSKDLIREIKDTAIHNKLEEKVRRLFARDADVWSLQDVFNTQLDGERFRAGFSNPKTEKIEKLFKRFGYASIRADLMTALGADFPACDNMVNHVVDQRNKIAHGDQVTAGSPQDLKDMAVLVKTYCRTLDTAVGDWFSSLGCAIR